LRIFENSAFYQAFAGWLSMLTAGLAKMDQIAPDNKIDWKALAEPNYYLGQTEHFIDRVLEQVRTVSSAD